LLVGVLGFQRVKDAFVEEYIKCLVEDGAETLIGHEISGGLLIVLLRFSIFRLVPTREEQA
jgi:hypothetical protein